MIDSIVLTKYDDIFRIFIEHYKKNVRCNLTVMDNGLSAEIKSEYNMYRYLPSPEPFSFCQAVNKGIRNCPDSDILIFNDDVIIKTDGLDRELKRVAYSDDKIGLVAPRMTNVASKIQQKKFDTDFVYVPVGTMVSFTLVFLKRQAIEKIGLLDEEFRHGIGGYEDTDYCFRLEREGYRLAIAQNCFVRHGGAEFGARISNTRIREGQLKKSKINRKYLRKKWSLKQCSPS